jgi:hypothetical protein
MNPQQNPQLQRNNTNTDDEEGNENNLGGGQNNEARTTRLRRLILITTFFAFYLTGALLANEHDEPTSDDGIPILPSSSPNPRMVRDI